MTRPRYEFVTWRSYAITKLLLKEKLVQPFLDMYVGQHAKR